MTFSKLWDLLRYLTDIAKFQQFTKIISKLKCEIFSCVFLGIGCFTLLSKYWILPKLVSNFQTFLQDPRYYH